MKMLSFALFISFSLCASCSIAPCGGVDKFLAKHEKFVNSIVDQKEDLTDEDWEELDTDFDDMNDNCYEALKPKMTKTQKRAYAKQNAKYAMLKVEHNMEEFDFNFDQLGETISNVFDEDFEDDMNDMVLEISDELEDVFDEDFQNKIKETFDEDFKETMKDAMGEIGEALKEAGEALKDALEDVDIDVNKKE